MNKEEILKRAREENKGIDAVKQDAQKVAGNISMAVGVCVCLFFTIMDRLVFQTNLINHVCWIIYGSMITTDALVYAVKLKKIRYWLLTLLAIASLVVLLVTLF